MTDKKNTSAVRPAKSAGSKKDEMTFRKVAQLLAVDRSTLENWREQGCPGIPPASPDVPSIKAWAEKNGKRAGDSGRSGVKETKTLEEIRKLKLANDQKEGRLVERAWVAERVQRASGDLNAFRAKSEAEHPTRFAAASGDVAQCRTIVRGIWDEVFSSIQTMQKHFKETV